MKTEQEKEMIRQIAWAAWKSAANAYRMYPDNKHTFTDYWHDLGKSEMDKALSAATPCPEGGGEDDWISSEAKPPYNKGVLVFIPDEDFHITSGMWDISNKWILLDEYREPECAVTHWMDLPNIPEPYKAEQQEHFKILKTIRDNKNLFKP